MEIKGTVLHDKKQTVYLIGFGSPKGHHGALFVVDGKFHFEGDMDESARAFAEYLNKNFEIKVSQKCPN